MPVKKILPKILIIFGFLALFMIVSYRSAIKEKLTFQFEKLKTHTDNFFFKSGPGMQRRPPLSLLQRETELRLYIGEPFNSFSEKQWQEFWDVIYEAYPRGAPEKEGLPRKMRQLTEDEIAFELIELYPRPFANFREGHWRIFFGIVLKK